VQCSTGTQQHDVVVEDGHSSAKKQQHEIDVSCTIDYQQGVTYEAFR
jgi:hypothetical protein